MSYVNDTSEAYIRELKQRIAQLEHNWQGEASFSRAIIDARDKRIAELEDFVKRFAKAGFPMPAYQREAWDLLAKGGKCS